MFVNGDDGKTSNDTTCFDSFRAEYNLKEIKKFVGEKKIITNIFRIQAYDSIMRGCFCIGFVVFILKGESLLEYTNLSSSKKYKMNDKIVLKYFQ